MPWRLIPVALVVAALLVAAQGDTPIGSYLVLLAVPAAAAAALATFGDLVELPGGAPGLAAARLAAAFAGLGLTFVVVAAAATRPALTVSALLAALVAFACDAVARTAAPRPRRAPAR